MFQVWTYLFSVTHLITKLRNKNTKLKFVKMFIIPRSICSIYVENKITEPSKANSIAAHLLSNSQNIRISSSKQQPGVIAMFLHDIIDTSMLNNEGVSHLMMVIDRRYGEHRSHDNVDLYSFVLGIFKKFNNVTTI